MHYFATWSGTIVHDTVEQAIRRLLDVGEPILEETLIRRAREALRLGWVQSRDGLWRDHPKQAVNLWEHYYGEEADRQKDRTEDLSRRVYQSLRHFAEGPFPEELSALPPGAVRNLEVLESIRVSERVVWVKPDLAFAAGERLWLVDWKTGTPKEEDRFQVSTYALLARDGWGIPPERVGARLVYLYLGEERSFDIDIEAVDAVKREIEASMETMLAVLRNPDKNEAAREDFPMTTDPAECRRCNFRQLCFGDDGVPGARVMGSP